MDMENFISNNYYSYASPMLGGDLAQADEFLLADYHGIDGCSIVNSLFINTFATEKDVVLVEAARAMQTVETTQSVQSVWLQTKAALMGWDTGTLRDIVGNAVSAENGELEIQGQIWLKHLLESKNSDDRETAENAIKQILRRQYEIFPEVRTEYMRMSQIIAETFQKRNDSMIDTLKTLRPQFRTSFLIAGSLHLKNDIADSSYSLKKWNDFFQKRKAVILFPKEDVVREKGTERRVILTRLFKEIVK